MKKSFVAVAYVLAVVFAGVVQANNARLTVINEKLDPVAGVQASFPLYLSRLGTYFAELYLESPSGVASATLAPLNVSVLVTFIDGEKSVFEREIAVKFNPTKRVATLFYVDTPFDLPQRQDLEMQVTLLQLDNALDMDATDIRIQLTRKPQILPFMR